jgi:hypothetical protein
MDRPMPSRKFLLSDAIVIVAATAVAMAMVRPFVGSQVDAAWKPFATFPSPSYTRWLNAGWAAILVASPFAMMWSLAVLGLTLRPPRARRGQLARRPGLVAGMSVAVVIAFRLVGWATMRLRLVGKSMISMHYPESMNGESIGSRMVWDPGFFPFGAIHALNSIAMIGVAVAASWMLLAMSGRWRADPSWSDRAGRALGVYWIATLPLTGWWDFHTWY